MLLLASAGHAAILFGGALSPPGLGALAWTEGENLSGTLVGEFDGLLRPPLTAHGGWVGARDAILGGVAAARFDTIEVGNARSLVGGTRISLDYRRYLWTREAARVGMYADAGAYGLVPTALTTDAGFTTSEQEEAAENDAGVRAQVGGLGGQLGVGAEYLFGDAQGRPAVALGVRFLARMHRGQVAQEDVTTVSTVLLTEAAFVVEFSR